MYTYIYTYIFLAVAGGLPHSISKMSYRLPLRGTRLYAFIRAPLPRFVAGFFLSSFYQQDTFSRNADQRQLLCIQKGVATTNCCRLPSSFILSAKHFL